MTLIQRGTGARISVLGAEIAGYTCMEDDILHRHFNGSVAVDDYVRFDQVGAYGITLKPPFIEPQAPIYGTSKTGELVLVQAGESWQEMFGLSRMPRSS